MYSNQSPQRRDNRINSKQCLLFKCKIIPLRTVSVQSRTVETSEISPSLSTPKQESFALFFALNSSSPSNLSSSAFPTVHRESIKPYMNMRPLQAFAFPLFLAILIVEAAWEWKLPPPCVMICILLLDKLT